MDNQHRSLQVEYRKHPVYKLILSNQGDVFNLDMSSRYTCKNKQGYLSFIIKVDGKRISLKVHRLIAETFLPPPSEEMRELCEGEHWGKVLVMHKDNNKLNNHADNLKWGTLKQNTQQAHEEGLIKPRKGSLNGRAKLTEDIVHEMCKFFEKYGTPTEAVEKFGVSMQQATKIRAGLAWKHIVSEYNIPSLKKRSTTIP